MLAAPVVDLGRQGYVCPIFLRLISMRHGSSVWLTCLVTTWFLAGCGESSPSPTTPSESSLAAPASPDGTVLTNSVGMDLKLIPAGTFTMGDNSFAKPAPAHQVTLTKDFYIGVYEVTQQQYEQIVGSNPSFPSHFKGANNPVEMVSWDDAVAFCAKLSSLPAEVAAGRVYRLPTEAEWEYACRAGTTTAYSFGDDEKDLGEYAWFSDNSGNTTHGVGEKLPNGWGLYDMHGNVWEWCSDADGSIRVFRGGSWFYEAARCRTALRFRLDPTYRISFMGFRLALSSPSGK